MSEKDQPSKGAKYLAILSCVILLIAVSLGLWSEMGQPSWVKIIQDRFPVIVGLPVAAIGAFIVVVFLNQNSESPIEFEAIGFKFKGPSGLVVLWLVCFLAIALAIKFLW